LSEPLSIGSISMRIYPHDLPVQDQIAEAKLQARLAVEAGFEGVMVAEHHAGFPGYFPNPHQIAGFLLPGMPHGWVAAAPMLLPMLPYSMYAEFLAWLNAAYPGRVGAGFAAGAFPADFEIVDVPFDEIVQRFKDSLPKVVAALRGEDPTQLGNDRALTACKEQPVPVVVAAQSLPAVRRAARLGIGILYDSLQTNEHSAKLSDAYDEAGGTAAKILIRRVWIGDPPEAQAAAQMQAFMAVATERAAKNWGDADQLVHGRDGVEAAEKLVEVLRESHADTVNIRVHLKGLAPEQVRAQIERHGNELLPHLRKTWAGAQ
jgi:alkanesulfonate monooxygenase SsuD/methylene tetrahydromethanopterin reductase-like flavin-dependent oxidoreductase (luciferase family)